ncbi:MAG: TaqI-like C-terminal specificity domain-containing protein [Paludibacteraceae bacterium]|nr:TaqI-like C-terminal specificity domain-containing protein [Paludibacteraceae bacterium]
MDYRKIIESKYNRQNWQELLYDIFRRNVEFWQEPLSVSVDNGLATSALYLGKITLHDGNTIAVYEVELSDSVQIERNRAGIRNLLCSNWRNIGCTGAFMFCYRRNEAVLRFSYVSESLTFAEDGTLKKENTDTKRFTYLLGEGHRSRTAIEQFEKLRDSELSLKDITKAFSIEALGDLFFKEYKKQYEDIIEYVTGKRMVKVANKWEEQTTGQPCQEIMQEFAKFDDAEKSVRDYVKKLMGRLVFIQFLQKKGWMGCPAGDSWEDGDKEFLQNLFANSKYKETFVDDVLEPLFDDINTKREDDLVSDPKVGTNIKVPYLNGGLFEYDDYDQTTFALPAKYMQNLLDFFASYNFTIDENDPDDAEIGVDPEMLGRIFENLLEDNKDKGAFYTPKEIVRYMCRESLIAYIQTDIEDEEIKNRIREFVTTHDISALKSSEVFKVDKKLRDVKICDPAIGSGAFPMGLLKELFDCRMAIEGSEEGKTPAAIKKDIIQNSIYGVDIEKGAVDIARLRFWLALIVDEDHPHALPNMDFKIMQGNSLLEQYEGVELSGMSFDEQRKKKGKKGDQIQFSIEFDEKGPLDNIQQYINDYYNTDNHDKKVTLRNDINSSIKNYILHLKGCTPDIQSKIQNLPIPNDKFFLWHIYFKEVFDKGGFDIVIGNPPYKIIGDSEKKMFSQKEYILTGHVDLYEIFIQHGMNILKPHGTMVYINPNTLLSNLNSKDLRKKIILDYGLSMIDNFKMDVFSEPTVHTCIMHYRKGGQLSKIAIRKGIETIDSLNKNIDFFLKIQDIANTENYTFDVTVDNEARSIFNKTAKYPKLGEFCYLRQCIKTGNDKIYVCKSEVPMNEPWKKTLRGKGIDRYYVKESDVYLKYGDWLARNWTNKSFYERSKIAIREAGSRITACLDNENRYFLSSIFAIYPKDDYNEEVLKYLLGVLNSSFATYYIQKIAFELTTGAFTKMRTNQLARLPIPLIESDNKYAVISIVNQILSAKQTNPEADTTSLESEIDRLVYELYGLTEEEIAIVEGKK